MNFLVKQSGELISNFLPLCLYVISWQPEKQRHTKAQRQIKKEKYRTRNMNSITPVCRLSTITNTVYLIKFEYRNKSIESCSFQTNWAIMPHFQMHDSINHGITVTPFCMSKIIKKNPKILFPEFLGYFTTNTGGKKHNTKPNQTKKKNTWKKACFKQQQKIHLWYIFFLTSPMTH